MIKINMLSVEQDASATPGFSHGEVQKQILNKAVFETLEVLRNRSYSGRHPELGRMINCICGHRHREVWVVAGKPVKCELKYSVGRWELPKPITPLIASQTTARGILGAQRFHRKRFHPHFSQKALQLVQRTQELYPEHAQFLNDPTEIMHEARIEAQRQLKKERATERKFKRRQRDIANRINRGLAKPGTRV